jgi:hypothetical protein
MVQNQAKLIYIERHDAVRGELADSGRSRVVIKNYSLLIMLHAMDFLIKPMFDEAPWNANSIKTTCVTQRLDNTQRLDTLLSRLFLGHLSRLSD